MQNIELVLPALHAGQQQIVADNSRFKVVCCGRRFGKTHLAIDIVTNLLLDGKSVGYFTPNYGDLEKLAWKPLKEQIAPIISRKHETYKTIETITGGFFAGFTMEVERPAQGHKFHCAIIDEAASIPGLHEKFQEAIRPTLVDYRGSVVFFSTPKGYNAFWNYYKDGFDPTKPDWASFHFTSYDNPFMSKEELDGIQLSTPQRTWDQEYLAKFVSDSGMVFRGVEQVTILDPVEPYPGEFVFGVDWGRVDDYTAISVMDVNTRQQVEIVRFNQIGWSVQYNRLIELYRKWQPYRIIAESNSIGDVNIEILAKQAWSEGLHDFNIEGFQTTTISKPIIIDDLTTAIERKQVELQNDKILVNELTSYGLNRLPSGRFSFSAPSGGHDDTVIATALSWHGLTESGYRLDWMEEGN